MRESGNYGFPWRVAEGVAEDLGVWIVLDRYGALVLRTKAKGVADLVVEMANTRNGQSRIEAAERAVVETALEWRRYDRRRHDLTNAEQNALDVLIIANTEAVDRLRDLRANQQAEECGAKPSMFVSVRQVVSDSEVLQREKDVRCHLPRGHEGEHEGELGTWRWAP